MHGETLKLLIQCLRSSGNYMYYSLYYLKILRVTRTVYLCVSQDCHNKQKHFPDTDLTT